MITELWRVLSPAVASLVAHEERTRPGFYFLRTPFPSSTVSTRRCDFGATSTLIGPRRVTLRVVTNLPVSTYRGVDAQRAAAAPVREHAPAKARARNSYTQVSDVVEYVRPSFPARTVAVVESLAPDLREAIFGPPEDFPTLCSGHAWYGECPGCAVGDEYPVDPISPV